MAKTRVRSELVKAANRGRVERYLLSHPCVDCGETDLRVLEFDHRPGEVKSADVGRLLVTGFSWTSIERELAKCDVRCSNCHRIVTCERANNWRNQASRRQLG